MGTFSTDTPPEGKIPGENIPDYRSQQSEQNHVRIRVLLDNNIFADGGGNPCLKEECGGEIPESGQEDSGTQFSVQDADENDLYAAMDWLLERKGRIEKKLAERHLTDGATVLYDVTSSYYEGHSCPWAEFGHDRDGQKGLPIIVYGVMTDDHGRPVSVEVYRGNTGDPTTVADQVEKLRQKFELSRVVLVGDRGMLTQTRIGELKKHPGLGWITALRSAAIRKLVEGGALQLSLFDEKNLAGIQSAD